MLVSVIIPTCDAQGTIVRALESLRAQTLGEWEAIVVADDRFDYAAFLESRGVSDPRLRFAATGRVRSGCHHARNVGLLDARGDLIAALDADDLFLPTRLATLAPLAMEHGAVTDNVAVVLDRTGAELYRALGRPAAPVTLDVARFFALSVPLFPLVRRDHVRPRIAGVEFAEDVVANLRLIDRLGGLLAVPAALYDYRVIAGSMSHSDNSAAVFDAAYAAYIERCANGDGFGLSAATRAAAVAGFTAKRALNAAFAQARAADPTLNFQTFVAARP